MAIPVLGNLVLEPWIQSVEMAAWRHQKNEMTATHNLMMDETIFERLKQATAALDSQAHA